MHFNVPAGRAGGKVITELASLALHDGIGSLSLVFIGRIAGRISVPAVQKNLLNLKVGHERTSGTSKGLATLARSALAREI